MSDKKFERQYDRNLVALDAKQRLIDLMANPFELPETGIYDEPVRYFKANLLWTPIIFGWLDWLEDIAGWQAAEDDNFRGIQEILVFEEGIEPIMTTPAEMQEAITEGIYKAFNDLAKQIVSGSRANFAVDEDGNLIPPGAGGQAPIEDDPSTPLLDEAAASLAGATITMQLGINDLFSDLDTFFGADSTPDTSLADCQFFINNKFITNEALMNAAIADYYTIRAASGAVITSLDPFEFSEWLYCVGYTHADINRYLLTLFISDVNSIKNAIDIVAGLEDAQFESWFAEGSGVFTTEYKDYGCVPIPPESFSNLQFGTVTDTNGIQKQNHRYQISTSGVFTDGDGNIQDTWYFVPVGGPPVFSSAHFNVTSTGFIDDPTAVQVPYRSDHNYTWTYDKDSDGITHINPVKNAGLLAGATGGFDVEIIDLGQFYVES